MSRINVIHTQKIRQVKVGTNLTNVKLFFWMSLPVPRLCKVRKDRCSRHVSPTTAKILNNKTIHKENQKYIIIDERNPTSEDWNSC